METYFAENPALPTAKAFPGMWKRYGAAMLAKDLDAAGIERESGHGIVDFHALRHTFGTLLALAGVAPKVAMDLMRHSDVNLTMALYSHTVLQDRAAALEKISPAGSQIDDLRATGTNNAAASPFSESLKKVDSETDSDRGQNGGILSHIEAYLAGRNDTEENVAKKIASP